MGPITLTVTRRRPGPSAPTIESLVREENIPEFSALHLPMYLLRRRDLGPGLRRGDETGGQSSPPLRVRSIHLLLAVSLRMVSTSKGLTTILTVDRDFEVYRIGGRKAFRVLPKR